MLLSYMNKTTSEKKISIFPFHVHSFDAVSLSNWDIDQLSLSLWIF